LKTLIKYSDIEKLAHETYVKYMEDEWCLHFYDIDNFIIRKKSYEYYFNYATIKLREKKLNKISKNEKN